MNRKNRRWFFAASAVGLAAVFALGLGGGSTAVLEQRPSAETYPYVMTQRKQLIADGTLIEKGGLLVFAKDAEFSSPSTAAAIIHGGSANGLIAWKSTDGQTLKQLDEQV